MQLLLTFCYIKMLNLGWLVKCDSWLFHRQHKVPQQSTAWCWWVWPLCFEGQRSNGCCRYEGGSPINIFFFFNFSGGPDKNQYYYEFFSLCSVFNQIARREGHFHYMNVINGHPTLMSCMHTQAVHRHKLQENAYICSWKPESLYHKLTLPV